MGYEKSIKARYKKSLRRGDKIQNMKKKNKKEMMPSTWHPVGHRSLHLQNYYSRVLAPMASRVNIG